MEKLKLHNETVSFLIEYASYIIDFCKDNDYKLPMNASEWIKSKGFKN